MTRLSADELAIQEQVFGDVMAERRAHLTREGWSPDHDDNHHPGELSRAGAAYALMAFAPNKASGMPWWWPWATAWWKPKTTERDLVRAAALIIAEVEALRRKALKVKAATGRLAP